MSLLITLEKAKEHLGITHADADGDIYDKAVQASEIVIRHLHSSADDTWTAATVPTPIQAAILLVLTHLYEHRGDDPSAGAAINLTAERILVAWRTAALA